MYKSLIEKICGELHTQIIQEDENMVMQAVRKVGVNVDKEELIKALQYDRDQYTKGYGDGKEDILNQIRAEIENHCGLAKEDHCKYCSYCNNVMGVREILEIIDKYYEQMIQEKICELNKRKKELENQLRKWGLRNEHTRPS